MEMCLFKCLTHEKCVYILNRVFSIKLCMHIGYVPRERPPFSALNFRSGAYHFHKLPKNPFRSITILYVLADFAVPETIIFKMTLISTRSSPPTAGSAAAAWRPEIRIFTLKTDQARSGAPHFQAQNGSSSFRSPAFSRSTGSSFRSPGPFFTLPRHIPTKIWVNPPPPPDSPSPFVIFTYRVLLLSNSKVLLALAWIIVELDVLLQY